MNQLTITPKKKDAKDRSIDETFGNLLSGSAFEQFSDDVLNDMEYTWERIKHGRFAGKETL